jgi:hypothetical protein
MYTVLAFLNIAAAGLLFGAMIEVAVADIPLFLELPRDSFIVVHDGIDRRKHPIMPVLSVIAVATSLGELWVFHDSWQVIFSVVGIIGIAAVAAISELINVPLNKKIKKCTTTSIYGDVFALRTQWIRGHYLRTIAAALSFAAFLIPILLLIQH